MTRPSLQARFLGVMKNIYDIHEALLRLSADKKEAIAGGAVSLLEETTRAEEVLLSRMSVCERQRTACCKELAELLGVKPEDITAQSFIERAEEPERGELAALAEKLRALFKELRRNNDTIGRMLRNRLEYIYAVIGAAGPAEPDAYDSRGKDTDRPPAKPKASLDKKV
jgi:flagellar biosynthesis/type III secretory pathway chaperone